MTDLSESDIVCNKCKQLFYYSMKQESQAPGLHPKVDKENIAPP